MKSSDLFERRQEWRSTLEAEGLLSLRGVEALSDEDLVAFAESLSDVTDGPKLLEWDFGKIMRMKYDAEAANYLFSAEKVPLHWDGPFHVEPRYLLFFCDTSEGDGGETVFVDTEAILAEQDDSDVAAWEGITLTYTTEKKAHYGGVFKTPVVRQHPFHGRKILRFAEVVETEKNPVHLDIAGTDDPDFYEQLEGLVTEPRYRYEHEWQAGDVVIVDNHSYLHGRNPLGENRGRSFRRIQIL